MGGEGRGPFSKPFRGWQEAGQQASESFQPPYLPVPPLGSLYELSAGQQFQVLQQTVTLPQFFPSGGSSGLLGEEQAALLNKTQLTVTYSTKHS